MVREMGVKIGIGQDSHRFMVENRGGKPLILGGVQFPEDYALEGNSDADVILHAICNAISSISGTVILGPVTDRMCLEEGVGDGVSYVREALRTLTTHRVSHVAITLECKKPRIVPHIDAMRRTIAEIMGIQFNEVGITATSGEGLTDFGRGLGIQAIVIITAAEKGM